MDYLCDYEPVMAEVCVSGNSVSHVHMLLAMVPRVRDVFNEARRLGFATADVLMFLLTKDDILAELNFDQHAYERLVTYTTHDQYRRSDVLDRIALVEECIVPLTTVFMIGSGLNFKDSLRVIRPHFPCFRALRDTIFAQKIRRYMAPEMFTAMQSAYNRVPHRRCRFYSKATRNTVDFLAYINAATMEERRNLLPIDPDTHLRMSDNTGQRTVFALYKQLPPNKRLLYTDRIVAVIPSFVRDYERGPSKKRPRDAGESTEESDTKIPRIETDVV